MPEQPTTTAARPAYTYPYATSPRCPGSGRAAAVGSVGPGPWEHFDPRCFLCRRGPLRMEIGTVIG